MNVIDARGLQCPLPVVKAKKAVEASNDAVKVLVDNEIAVQNLMKLAKYKNIPVSCVEDNGNYTVVLNEVKHER